MTTIYVTPEMLGTEATEDDVNRYVEILKEQLGDALNKVQIVRGDGYNPRFSADVQAARDRAWQRFCNNETADDREPSPGTSEEKYGVRISATYDPGDNKIRLRASSRLPAELYQRVKAHGFAWAPRQELFVAPSWTPAREDFAIELAGELEDEDTTLVDRAEERADRFEVYKERRAGEAHAAREAVEHVSKRFEFGQPILVGHHSERRARKDAERIQNGMRKAVKLWETSAYWRSRAAGAIRHAKYKERVDVRARRIAKLEADRRGFQRTKEHAERTIAAWSNPDLMMSQAIALANTGGLGIYRTYPLVDYPRQPPASQYEGETTIWSALTDGIIDQHKAAAIVVATYRQRLPGIERWLTHLDNRLMYERAMLEDAGGLPGAPGARFDYAVGGRVLRRGKWYPIAKLNKRDGQVISLGVVGHFASTITFDEVQDYRPPAEGDAEKVKAATDKGPMCNYPGPGFVHMTAAEWKAIRRWSDGRYTELHKATETHGRHRTKCRPTHGFKIECVYITDAKRVDPPPPAAAPAPKVEIESDPQTLHADLTRAEKAREKRAAREAEDAPFDAIKSALKAGVTVVSAPQLFPTPAPLAARMVAAADIQSGMRVLEPSAGTGSLLEAIVNVAGAADAVGKAASVVAVEINATLANALRVRRHLAELVICSDFLSIKAGEVYARIEVGRFDRVVMNPPFERGADIEHIRHALTFLAPGGRLVALCADGPGRGEAFEPLIAERGGRYMPLGEVGFEGTKVRVAMVVINGAG